MMSASDATAPAQLNPFNAAAPQQPMDEPLHVNPATSSVASVRKTPPNVSSLVNTYSALPTIDTIQYANIAHSSAISSSPSHIALDVPSAETDRLSDGSNSAAVTTTAAANAAFTSIQYYQKWFDVTTDIIQTRVRRSLTHLPSSAPFIALDEQPDLYGPFWITTTLVLVYAVCANLASYLEFSESDSSWEFSIRYASVATSTFYSYLCIAPIALYAILLRVDQPKPFVDCVCLVGYSLTPLILGALLCVIPVSLVRWIIVAIVAAVQSSFLIFNIWTDRSNPKVLPVAAVIVAVHIGFALLTIFYFFNF